MPTEKEAKKVFVIMPFERANERNQKELDEYFKKTLKKFIEGLGDLEYQYEVTRSGTEFNINKNIILQLHEADIVICDLSGSAIPNPNVMFELGIRFSVSRRPVILCREQNEDNQSMFDIGWLHTHEYRAAQPDTLQDYIQKKLKEYETNPTAYESPVLDVIGREFEVGKEAKRNEVVRALAGINIGLWAVELGMFDCIATYLTTILGDDPTPDTLDKFRSWWMYSREKLEGYDWSQFMFDLRSFSPLEILLVELKLIDYLPDEVKKLVPSLFMKFYIDHIASTNSVAEPFAKTSKLFLDTGKIGDLAGLVRNFIATDDPSKRSKIYDSLLEAIESLQN